MNFSDLNQLYLSGLLLRSGEYQSLYPLPTVGFFALLSLVPFWVACLIVVVLSLLAMVSVLRWRAVLWVLFVPTLQVLMAGQVDILIWWLMMRCSAVALALATLKPQLFIFAIPQLLSNRKLWKPFIGWCMVLYIPITLIRPMWIFEWVSMMNDGRIGGGTSASAWSAYWLFALIGVALVLGKKHRWKMLSLSANPAVRPYDYSLLMGTNWLLIPISYGAQYLCNLIGSAYPATLIGIALPLLSSTQRWIKMAVRAIRSVYCIHQIPTPRSTVE